MLTDSHDITTLLRAAPLDPEAHPEDAFVAGFAAYVGARGGGVQLAELALDYARDVLDEVLDRGVALDLDAPGFQRAVAAHADRSCSILAARLRRFVLRPTGAPKRPDPSADARVLRVA